MKNTNIGRLCAKTGLIERIVMTDLKWLFIRGFSFAR